MRPLTHLTASGRTQAHNAPSTSDNEFMRTAERSMSQLLGRNAGEMFDQMIPLGRRATGTRPAVGHAMSALP